MGLDMYLEARKHIDATNWREMDFTTKREEYLEVTRLFPEGSDEYADGNGATVSIPIGYWRKANAIHAWFVNKVQNGVDECQEAYVSPEKLRELRATVQHVLESKSATEAQKHLAPAQGCFFGTYEIDEWYWGALERTEKILDKAITLAEEHDCSIYYQSSW